MDFNDLRRLVIKARLNNKTVEELDSHEFSDWLTFDDRDSYLEWVYGWKVAYRLHSDSIRKMRANCKNMQRAEAEIAPKLQSELCNKGMIARGMLALRHAAKKHSWALKEEAKFATV